MTGIPDYESELATRFAALANRDDGDWLDVRRRARRARVRHALLLAVVPLVAAAVAAPAFGLHRAIIDWFRAEPAPERVQLSFSQLAVGAPEGMDPGVIPDSARKVTEVRHDGKTHVLWVAPTEHGGFCYTWTELWAGCYKDRNRPPTLRLSPDLNPFLLGVTSSPDPTGVMRQFGGVLFATETERLVAKFADGDELELPIVWVSPPIDAGFYLHWASAEHRRAGHHLTAVSAHDADGEVLARQTFALTPAAEVRHDARLPNGQMALLPPTAIVEQAGKLIDFRAENGQPVTLWVVPTRDGGRCFAHNRGSGCPPGDLDLPLAVSFYPGSRPVLVLAQVRDEVVAVELRYEDGTVERLVPTEGFILHEIGAAHYERGHRLAAAVAFGADGRVLGRQPFKTDSPGVYPCVKPVDQGHGVMMCP